MIKNIYVFNNLNIACTDEKGQQVTKEQESLLEVRICNMLKRKVVNSETMVFLPGSVTQNPMTVGQILGLKK